MDDTSLELIRPSYSDNLVSPSVVPSPELPSVLQRWLDHDASESKLIGAVARSSQRMMRVLVLAGDASLYGRAQELLPLGPIHE